MYVPSRENVIPRYFTLSSGGTATDQPGVVVPVTSRRCLPFCSSAWATSFPSGEMAAATDVPVLVNCFIGRDFSVLSTWSGGLTGLKMLSTKRAAAGRNRRTARTPLAPAKIAVAALCALISANRESAVEIACDFRRVKMREPPYGSGEG